MSAQPERLEESAEPSARSVSIAVSVLECFLDSDELGASEVARRLNVAKSTAHRSLVALARGGLLERMHNGRYRLGLRLYDYGQLAISRLLLRELALPILAELRDQVSETVQLGIPAGAEVLYIDRLEGMHGLRFHTDMYRRVRAHSSSSGKVLAAFNAAVYDAVMHGDFERVTPRTVTNAAAFNEQIATIRSRGWVLSIEEAEVGLSSIAAPVFLAPDGPDRSAIAAISVAGPTQRVGGRAQQVAPHVLEAAQRLSKELQHHHR